MLNRAGLPRMLAVDLRAVSIAEGVRAALSVAVIVALNEWLAYPPVIEAALATLLTCLCDPGGPIRRRLPSILAFAVFGALITAGFGLLRNAPVGVILPCATLGVFCTSFARVFGQPAMQVGNLLTVVLVLALRAPPHGLDEAALLGGMFFAGSAWALLLTVALWRIHPYRPARRAVADCFRALAALTRDLRLIITHPNPHETMWDRHAREHRRFVRDSIERARAAVLATARERGPMVAASGIALVCTTPVEVAAALFPLAVVALSVRGVSFGLFIACITPLVVLLSELGRPGESELTIALMRALYTLIGGVLAVVGSFLLWPVWEPGRLAAGLRAAISAHAAYAAAEISALLGEVAQGSVDPARQAAGMASNNLEASLQRALLEPHGEGARIEAALTVDAALRRMAGRLSALQLDAHTQAHDRAAWGAWRAWIVAAMGGLAEGRSEVPARPALPRNDPHAEALARIARQVELAAGVIGRG